MTDQRALRGGAMTTKVALKGSDDPDCNQLRQDIDRAREIGLLQRVPSAVPISRAYGDLTALIRYARSVERREGTHLLLVHELFAEAAPDLTLEELRELLPHIWVIGRPQYRVDAHVWVKLFRRAGFKHVSPNQRRPSHPMRLYRGASPSARRGMSWTPNIDMATLLSADVADLDIYEATVPPEAMLALFELTPSGRHSQLEACEGPAHPRDRQSTHGRDGNTEPRVVMPRTLEVIVDPAQLPRVKRLPQAEYDRSVARVLAAYGRS